MPRDGKGKPFGIGDTLKVIDTEHPDFGREFVVGGFVVSKDVIPDTLKTGAVGAYWHQVELVKENPDLHPEQRDAAVAEHTDQCYADQAQRDGLVVPADRLGVSKLRDDVEMSADKWVWGG